MQAYTSKSKSFNRGFRHRSTDLGCHPSKNLDINQPRSHCWPSTMDIVLFERATKKRAARTLGVRAAFIRTYGYP